MPTSVDSIEALQDEVVKLDKYKTTGYVVSHGLLKEFQLTSDKQGQFIHIYALKAIGIMDYDHYRADTIVAAFEKMAKVFAQGTVYLQTILVEQPQGASDELVELTRAAWGARFSAAPMLGDAEISVSEARKEAIDASLKDLKDNLWSNLISGKEGVSRWNSMRTDDLTKINWSKSDLSGLELNGVRLRNLNLQGAKFDNSKMSGATLDHSLASGASFKGAKLDESSLQYLQSEGADFSDASLVKANLRYAELKGCKFSNTDLTGASLTGANLKGVDLKTAKLDNAQFDGATYDGTTVLPEAFSQWSLLKWKGKKELDPYKRMMRERLSESLPATVSDFGQFMMYVQAHFDEGRLEKAFQMLKQERFELFSEVSAQGVLGIVKSQTNPDLVYACRLVENGSFTCCTQNLKPCGGLRGALCKHLLVLIIGLAKANELDLNAVVKWILASALEKPVIDKPVLTEVFLKYSGVEAGEIDWRPTETTPEDYYAF